MHSCTGMTDVTLGNSSWLLRTTAVSQAKALRFKRYWSKAVVTELGSPQEHEIRTRLDFKALAVAVECHHAPNNSARDQMMDLSAFRGLKESRRPGLADLASWITSTSRPKEACRIR